MMAEILVWDGSPWDIMCNFNDLTKKLDRGMVQYDGRDFDLGWFTMTMGHHVSF